MKVPIPGEIMSKTLSTKGAETSDAVELDIDDKVSQPATKKSTQKPVNQRWYYEPVMEKELQPSEIY